MTWHPQQEGLRTLVILLRDAADPNNPEQALMNRRLSTFQDYPDYNAYLAYILMKFKTQDMKIRTIAGQQLKFNIKNQFNSIPLRVLDYIKQSCIDIIQFPDESCICEIVSCIISAIISRGQVHNSLSLFMLLIEKLQDPIALEFSLNTLVMICTDSAPELDEEIQGIRPLRFMMPSLITCYSNSDSHIRVAAMNATSQFILLKQESFIQQLDDLLIALLKTMHDSDIRVRQEFCKIISVLLEAYPKKLEPYLTTIIKYMIQALNDSNEMIVLNACDFWIQYAHSNLYKDQLIPYLNQLVPNLLQKMIYSESDLLDLNEFVPQEQSIHTNKKNQSNTIHELSDVEEEDSDFDNHSNYSLKEEEDDDLIEDAEFYSRDSSRQSSASALDILSVTFRNDFCTILLDILLNQTLNHQHWLIRESGILALGAAAEGGIDIISQHLDTLIPYLLKSMGDVQPLVRSISCWAISRFSNWLVHEHKATRFFEPVLFGLLNGLLDSNKRVQESACTGFIVLAETSTKKLVPYIYQILSHTNRAFLLYKKKNRLFLYDAMGTLADAVKSELNQPQFIYLLLPPLITKWNELSDKDTDLFPLLECLSNITAALGPGFIQYVDPVLSRCVKLISSTLQEQMLADENPETVVPPNVEFLIAALDLLSGIVQGLGATIKPLIAQTNPPLLSLLAKCIHDPVSEVLQSTFALLGDIAVASFDSLIPYLHIMIREMIQILCNQNYIISISVYNNVIWALGEIMMRCEFTQVECYIPSLIQVLLPLLTHPNVPNSIHENAMIALGRLGLVGSSLVAPHLNQFIQPWLETSMSVREGEEKETAFRGLCAIIKLNAQDAHKQLRLLLVTISTWQTPSQLLLADFHHLLKELYQNSTQEQWNNTLMKLNLEAQNRIHRILLL